ncbi:MAG TPA: hypothetical protein VLS89_06110 [Candidatus Nanopelagicales bacterium]|nr:hypothetical protein [Candidatus Nanopelagicales bacterium]
MEAKEIVKEAAAGAWGITPEQVRFAGEVSEGYAWLERHAMWLAVDEERRRMLVAVDTLGRAIAFPGGGDLEPLNRLLRMEDAALPGGLAPVDLARAIRELSAGAGGFVGSAAFLEAQRPMLMGWVRPEHGDAGVARFVELCADPELHSGDEGWWIRFHFFNLGGGVERWEAQGDARSVTHAASQAVLPEGTLVVPYG